MIIKKNDQIFPIGFKKYHRNKLFNFTLNRFYSLGFAKDTDLIEAGKRIKSYRDFKGEMLRVANIATVENRIVNAAIYYRGAEFFALPDDPDKVILYDKFKSHFYRAFSNDQILRFKIPYETSFIPALKLLADGEKKGTILLHGGMDSFIEEWYLMMKYLAGCGYDVIGFEGPGQGEALIKNGIPFNIDWEKPTSALLDFFKLEDVTLIGLSVGGWLALRAAAFEPRIKRVIASGHAIDYMDIPPTPLGWLFKYFMRYENFFNKSAYWKMEKSLRMKWEINQTMHITKSKSPLEAAKKMALGLSLKNMHPENIEQDVLILSGKKDHFIPVRLHKKQVKALINARSVTDKIFTKNENAQNHCQIGNIELGLETIVNWLETKS